MEYIGAITTFAGTFAPRGWALCSGQLLPISENDVLFIGTSYGGDGEETFALPDLRPEPGKGEWPEGSPVQIISLYGVWPSPSSSPPGTTDEPLMGTIRMFAGTFAPKGYALCNGQLLPISEHSALFSIMGTRYGGDGKASFALPDLRPEPGNGKQWPEGSPVQIICIYGVFPSRD
jgi:microcystin-dependent protein